MRTLHLALLLSLVLSNAAAGQEKKSQLVCWARQAVVAIGVAYDAPSGKPVGSMNDDGARRAVDHWQGEWALVTSETEPRVGWIMRSSVKQYLATLMCLPAIAGLPPLQEPDR